jgi:hypothetical protein
MCMYVLPLSRNVRVWRALTWPPEVRNLTFEGHNLIFGDAERNLQDAEQNLCKYFIWVPQVLGSALHTPRSWVRVLLRGNVCHLLQWLW